MTTTTPLTSAASVTGAPVPHLPHVQPVPHIPHVAQVAHAAHSPQRLARAAQRRYTHAAAPRLERGSMAPQPWLGFAAGIQAGLKAKFSKSHRPAAPAAPLRGWQRAASKRRNALITLVLVVSAIAATLLLRTQPMQGVELLRLAQVGLFTLLFAWVSAGCITAVMGWQVLRRGDVHMLSYRRVAQHFIATEARTALVMPICNEHVATVFAGLQATAESLVEAGGARLCEIYVLSDSSEPSLRAAERAAWLVLRDRFARVGLRVHYRWRLRRTQRKAGNVADFCRRWGKRHRYMVVLDADSVMSGEGVLGLVRLMEANPQCGIVQSAPVACGVDTLHARAQQFAGKVTGRLFSAGMQYWQLGESHYWGHNAIIRIAPFMAHCGLAKIKGSGGLAGEILSHDFVEAALMRRAGWQVRLVTDLPGSWEQQPPHLLAELQRDRRWCQGNLQNARLIAEPGLHRVHRAMFATGAMSYLSAPLWLGFVVLGLAIWLNGGHTWIVPPPQLPLPLLLLWASTVCMLLLPRVLGVALVLQERQQHLYGGSTRLVASAVLEALLSALQAPVRMAAHSSFVLGAFTGIKLRWTSPPREATRLRWRDAAPALLPLGVLAAAGLALSALAEDGVAVWLSPVAVPLVLAWPLAVWASRPALGQRLRRAGLLMTPEESAPSQVLQAAWSAAAQAPARAGGLDVASVAHIAPLPHSAPTAGVAQLRRPLRSEAAVRAEAADSDDSSYARRA